MAKTSVIKLSISFVEVRVFLLCPLTEYCSYCLFSLKWDTFCCCQNILHYAHRYSFFNLKRPRCFHQFPAFDKTLLVVDAALTVVAATHEYLTGIVFSVILTLPPVTTKVINCAVSGYSMSWTTDYDTAFFEFSLILN